MAGVGVLFILFGVGCLAYVFKDELAEFMGDDRPLSILLGALAFAGVGFLVAASVAGFLGSPDGRRLVVFLGDLLEGVLVVGGVVAIIAAVIGFLIWVDDSGPGPPRHGGGEGTGSDHRSSDDGGWGGDGGDGGGGD